jgi:hypothetical protein
VQVGLAKIQGLENPRLGKSKAWKIQGLENPRPRNRSLEIQGLHGASGSDPSDGAKVASSAEL